jgi:hypothetical protein
MDAVTDFPAHVAGILEAARLAPSWSNTQPWRVVVEGERLSFVVDEQAAVERADPGGRMARLSLGAAVECALLRARRMGCRTIEEPAREGALVTVTFTSPKREPEPDKALIRRATQRRAYDGRPLEEPQLRTLRDAAPPLGTARAHWFGRERVRALGPLAEEVEALLWENGALREAELAAIRFDVKNREEVTHGLPVSALELTSAERATLDAMRRMPADVLATIGAFRKMGARARRLVESASGVLVIAARDAAPETDVNVGRTMQRAWLALTRLGMVAHPQQAYPRLEALLEVDEAASGDPAWTARAAGALADYRAAFPSIEREARIALVMRIGWCDAPAVRVGRRPVHDVVDAAGAQARDLASAAEDVA